MDSEGTPVIDLTLHLWQHAHNNPSPPHTHTHTHINTQHSPRLLTHHSLTRFFRAGSQLSDMEGEREDREGKRGSGEREGMREEGERRRVRGEEVS